MVSGYRIDYKDNGESYVVFAETKEEAKIVTEELLSCSGITISHCSKVEIKPVIK